MPKNGRGNGRNVEVVISDAHSIGVASRARKTATARVRDRQSIAKSPRANHANDLGGLRPFPPARGDIGAALAMALLPRAAPLLTDGEFPPSFGGGPMAPSRNDGPVASAITSVPPKTAREIGAPPVN